jgi:hypothetical protein
VSRNLSVTLSRECHLTPQVVTPLQHRLVALLAHACHCRMSKITGYSTERTKPFPIKELDFSRNEIGKEGIGAVVQFARTQGSDATRVDLSRNKLDDAACQEEVTRLVKNYSTFASNAFISTLIVSGNQIGRAGACWPLLQRRASLSSCDRAAAPPRRRTAALARLRATNCLGAPLIASHRTLPRTNCLGAPLIASHRTNCLALIASERL